MKASKELILRQVAGEYILVPTGSAALRIHGMINLSESGALIWEQLSEERTEEELVKAVLLEYQVEEATARADVAAFLEQMRGLGILEEEHE